MIDDAIASRATARIRYRFPIPSDLKQIWKVISENSKIKIEDSVIDDAVRLYPKISGRDVKNIIKLAHLMCLDDNSSITIDKIAHVTRFKQTEYSEEEQQEIKEEASNNTDPADPEAAKKERQRLRRLARKNRKEVI
jgi:hypothetical protein